jgi:hypothetical protein
MMTLGPVVMLLAVFENARTVRPMATHLRTRSSLFYVTHIYLIHGLAIVFALVTYPHLARSGFGSPDETAIALGLPGVYVVWLFVLILLYPLCRWFAELKQSHTARWWSYL